MRPQPLAVGIGQVDLPAGDEGRHIRIRWTTQPPALAVASRRAELLIRRVRCQFGVMAGLEPLGGEQQPSQPSSRDPLGLIPPMLLKLAQRLALPFPPPTLTRHPLGIERIPLTLILSVVA